MSVVISLQGVGKSFAGRPVLHDVDLEIRHGDVVGIVGPSGAGKSTLLRTINQLERHDRGTVAINGQAVAHHLPDRKLVALRAQVGMIFQQFNLWPHMTVLGNVIEAPIRVARATRAVAVADGLRFLAQVGLADRAQDYPSQLSGGQQQRVAIARALAMRPVSILFDEPTSALDPKLASEVLATMSGLAAQNVTMLVVTHEMSFARRVATRIVYMSAGRIVQDCPTREFFEDQRDPEVQAFLSHG